MSPERAAANAFDLGGDIIDIKPLGRGLINDTFLVKSSSRNAVLQRINRRAFPEPELIMQNLRALSDYCRERQPDAALALPSILSTRAGGDFLVDERGDFWRVLSYIDNTVALETVANPRQAEAVGAALGRFHSLASGLDTKRLHATRPRFHKTPAYFERFATVAAQTKDQLASADLNWCVEFAHARRDIVSVLEDAKERGELSLRVIHGDPKVDNFLFDARAQNVVSLIDLDTVQPGLVHYDIGDCLRSCANPAGESPKNVADARFDLAIGRALLKRYLAETRRLLTPQDIAYLYDAIRLIPFELGLRFLTDHLEGDVYFKTERRGHNLHRATVQFRLTEDIERNADAIQSTITALTR